MFGIYKWVNNLPREIRLSKIQIQMLDNLRKKYTIPDDVLVLRILSSDETTRKLQIAYYLDIKMKNPKAKDYEIYILLLKSRPIYLLHNCIKEDEIESLVKSFNHINDLINWMINEDHKEPSFPDPFGIGFKIDQILGFVG